MDENANSQIAPSKPIPTASPKNPELLARMVIRENKPFNTSALACGYSQSIADKGLANLVRVSSAVSAAVKRETTQLSASLDVLKPLAVQRLYTEITDLRRPGGLKAIEIAGRFKETDWFVRNVDVQIGVFASLGERSPAEDTLDTYKDE